MNSLKIHTYIYICAYIVYSNVNVNPQKPKDMVIPKLKNSTGSCYIYRKPNVIFQHMQHMSDYLINSSTEEITFCLVWYIWYAASPIHWLYRWCRARMHASPDSKVHGANTGSTGVLSAPDWPNVGLMNLAIRKVCGLSWHWFCTSKV